MRTPHIGTCVSRMWVTSALTIVHWNASHHVLAVLQAKAATSNGIGCIQSFINIIAVTKSSYKHSRKLSQALCVPFDHN